ncbi:MAG TPA: fused MFS/spermidine synthase [Vicinamibacteria bacterium]
MATWPGSRVALNLAVFVTGAAVLILEIAATRLLSPYYGSTLYTISGVITVVLGALSFGYSAGGRLADRHPEASWFYGVIAVSGVAVLVLRVLAATLLPAVGFDLPLATGPLVMSLALFFLPCFLLALLSPWAVKLRALACPEVGSGENAGSVFFWSTLGSIGGSLSVGFYLVPALGLSRLFLCVGLVLTVLGGAGFLASRPAMAPRAAALALPIVAALAGLPAVAGTRSSALYSRDGVYQKIQVFDTTFADRPARELWLDRSASGVMFRDGDDLAYAYTRYYRLIDAFCPRVERALVLGAGPFSVPKALLAGDAGVVVDVVDIEPDLLPLAERFFGFEKSPRLHNHVTDARGFLQRTRERYDLIFMDVYYSITIPVHLTTREYFELARERLSEDGIVVANVLGDLGAPPPSLLGSMARTFRAAFPQALFVATESVVSRHSQNVVFVGARAALRVDAAEPRLAAHPLAEIRDLPRHLLGEEQLPLDRELVLTDESALTELLTLQQLDRFAHEDDD